METVPLGDPLRFTRHHNATTRGTIHLILHFVLVTCVAKLQDGYPRTCNFVAEGIFLVNFYVFSYGTCAPGVKRKSL